MKSYTGSKLSPNSMILDDLERQNRGFYGFIGNFELVDTFQERIAPNSLQIDQDKLNRPIKFSALNADFNGTSLDLLGSRFKETCARKHQ